MGLSKILLKSRLWIPLLTVWILNYPKQSKKSQHFLNKGFSHKHLLQVNPFKHNTAYTSAKCSRTWFTPAVWWRSIPLIILYPLKNILAGRLKPPPNGCLVIMKLVYPLRHSQSEFPAANSLIDWWGAWFTASRSGSTVIRSFKRRSNLRHGSIA